MLKSTQYNFIFVHIYKTGGTSIAHKLLPYSDLRFRLAYRYGVTCRLISGINRLTGQQDHGNEWVTGFHMHATCTDICETLPDGQWSQYYTFAFVRNPWDWLVSLYHYIRQAQGHKYQRDLLALSFDDFVRNVEDFDIQDQSSFVTDTKGRIMVDFVGHFEQISTDFRSVCHMLGLPGLPVQHLNRSTRKRDYSYYYDATLRSIVGEKFKRDIELFGYSFDGGLNTGNSYRKRTGLPESRRKEFD